MAGFYGGCRRLAKCTQAMEALIYNFEQHAIPRAGAQVPFSSLNIGTETTPTGRMIINKICCWLIERGLGRGENPIFPNIIFRLQQGVNLYPGDPNYDMFQLAIFA